GVSGRAGAPSGSPPIAVGMSPPMVEQEASRPAPAKASVNPSKSKANWRRFPPRLRDFDILAKQYRRSALGRWKNSPQVPYSVNKIKQWSETEDCKAAQSWKPAPRFGPAPHNPACASSERRRLGPPERPHCTDNHGRSFIQQG